MSRAIKIKEPDLFEKAILERDELLKEHPHLKQYQDKIDEVTKNNKTSKQRLINIANISKEIRANRILPEGIVNKD